MVPRASATVTGFVTQIINYLRPMEPKHIVIACNTATALALATIRPQFPDLTISGVIEPGARAAIDAAGAKAMPLIAIISTEATARSKAYEHAIHRRRNHAQIDRPAHAAAGSHYRRRSVARMIRWSNLALTQYLCR